MICFEIKKIFSKTISRISLIVLLFSLVISCYFAITNITYIDNRGVSHTGIAAARNLRKEKQRWEGVLDKAALQAVIDEYRKVNEEYPIRQGDYTANLLHDSKVQGFSEIKDMINMGFCEFRDFNYYRIDSVSKDEVGKLYENREKSLEKWLSSEETEDLFNKKEKAFLLERYHQMKTPLYYEDYDGWKSALHYAQTIVMLVMLVSAFLVSGIFPNEFSWKADSIFFSTKYGRDRGTRAKLIAGLIVVTAIYWMIIALYSVIVLGCLGFGGGNVMIQTGFWHWKSFYNITYMQLYLLTIVSGYIGTLFCLLLSMLIAGLIVVTAIYWMIIALYSVIVLGCLGFGGGNVMIQTGFWHWKSFYNITYMQLYLLTIVSGYIGTLFCLLLSMLISAKTHTAVVAVTIPFAILFLPLFLSNFHFLKGTLGVFPDQLLQINEIINIFNLYQIGGKIVGSIPIMMVIYPILSVTLLPIIYCTYHKTEIK
jgi:hypothetical protein